MKWYNLGRMSGHSKWSTIKRQKQSADFARGQIFTKLANAITFAVRDGGGVADPENNFKLRLAIEKARQNNMPKHNIERAILRASGKLGGGAELTEVLYEGFAPAGVAILAEGVTDNRERTSAAVKNAFVKNGGSLGGTGSVAYLFTKMGAIHVAKDGKTYDQMLETVLEADAVDLEDDDDRFIIYTEPADLHKVKAFLEHKMTIIESELTYKPKTLVSIMEKELAQKVVVLLWTLEGLDDIHKVYSNARFPVDL